MTPEEFRRWGHAVVDWIADYWQRVEALPVLSRVAAGRDPRRAPACTPAGTASRSRRCWPTSTASILPGITHWQSPKFFAYFPANTSGPSILGELLSAGLGVQGMLWATSPACTELETHVLDWMVDMLGLPRALPVRPERRRRDPGHAPRARRCAPCWRRGSGPPAGQANERGCDGRLVAYASTQAHSSVEKAVRIAGLGRENLRLIEVDERFAMRPDALARPASRPTGPPAGCRASSAPPSARPRPTPSTRCPRSARSAASTASGCTSTAPWPAPRRSAPSSATSRTGWSWPTATASTPTSGCSPTSTATASAWPTGRR